MPPLNINRRTFVLNSTCTAVVIATGCGDDSTEPSGSGDGSTSAAPTAADDSGSTGTPGSTGAEGSGSGGSTDAADDSTGVGPGTDSGETGSPVCEATDPDIEGPFYRPDIPIRDNLDLYDDPGDPLVLQGRVLNEACTPVANAVVELWQASPRPPGSKPGDLDGTYDDTADYRYYGQVATNERGEYSFTTLMPGWYLNGAEYRPAHLHMKVWVRGTELLNTQLYFEGDPFNEGDPWFNPDNMVSPDNRGLANYDLHVAAG
ncbi:MAG: hypothetical protein AAF799_31845 [Myxococcota bacterium]